MREAVSLEKQRKRSKKGVSEYWILRWYDTDGKHRSRSLGRVEKLSKQQARKIALEKEQELQRYRGKCPTLSAHIEYYFNHIAYNHAKNTIEVNQRAARYMKAFFDDRRKLDTFTPQDAKKFRTALVKGDLAHINQRKCTMTEASADVYLKFARALFGVAVKEDIIGKNPFSGALFNVESVREWKYIKRDVFEKLIENASPKIGVLLALCRLAALRCSEALHLRFCDVNFETGLIHVTDRTEWRTKSKKSRTVPMCRELAAVLLCAFESAEEGQTLFIHKLRRDNTQRDIAVVCQRTGYEPYPQPTHSLRKSCITDWASSKPPHVVQEWAGHADLKTTMKYYTKTQKTDYEKVTEGSHWNEIYPENVPENTSQGDQTEVTKAIQTLMKAGLIKLGVTGLEPATS